MKASLSQRMRELRDLAGLIELAAWDQETYLPAKASDARGHQLAALQGAYHARLCDPALGDLLDDSPASRVLRRERDRAVKVPERLVRALAQAQSRGIETWRAARLEKSFAGFAPALAELLALRREQADAIGHGGDRYDALLAAYEPGMTVARLTPVLTRLTERLVPLAARLKDPTPDPLAGRHFPAEVQEPLARHLLADMGFDFGAGRLDRAIHPFSRAPDVTDVRLTTRVDERTLWPCVFITLHEGGHGLYAQGFAPEDAGTPLALPPSMGLDESQSRLWENQVGHSRAFCRAYFPLLQQTFPAALGDFDADRFYRTINRVAPSLIRGGSDEVTYNLHIVLRYELERALLADRLPLSELPAAWNARMTALLGVTPTHDTEGVLQDIHWATGDFGYFPTYTLGNLYGASLFAALRRDVPDLDDRIERRELRAVGDWMRAKVHVHGARFDAEALVTRICGHGLRDDDFVAHLEAKYGASDREA